MTRETMDSGSEIYEALDATKKQIRILHVEDELDFEGRLQCHLEVISLSSLQGDCESSFQPKVTVHDYSKDRWENVLRSTENLYKSSRCWLGPLPNSDYHKGSSISEEILATDGAGLLGNEPKNDATGRCDDDRLPTNFWEKPSTSRDTGYRAISWVWGDSRKRCEITLNGKMFEISQNAEDVLRHLVHKRSFPKVWLDAICINQADQAEKEQQVAIMGDVYRKADSLAIWIGLGKSDRVCEAAFASIDKLIIQCRQATRDLRDLEDVLYTIDRALQMRLPRQSQDALPDCDWKALEDLYSSPWFTRVWVLQEVMLSTSPICFFGSASRLWSQISLAAAWLKHRLYARSEYIGHYVRGIETTERKWSQARGYRSFQDSVILGIDLDATVPHDKVYAMLSILQDTPLYGDQATIKLVPDYGEDLSTVYAKAIKLCFNLGGGPSAPTMLSWAERLRDPDGEQGWPSWVAQFHRKGSAAIDIEGVGHAANFAGLEFFHFVVDNHTILVLCGVVHSHIVACAAPLSRKVSEDYSSVFDWVKESLTIAPCSRFSRLAAAIELTLDGNESEYHAKHQKYRSLLESLIASIDTGLPMTTKDGARLYRGFQRLCVNRRFFTTSDDSMGMGPADLQPGDHICALRGGPELFALREHNGHFTLVGLVYVYNVSDVSASWKTFCNSNRADIVTGNVLATTRG